MPGQTIPKVSYRSQTDKPTISSISEDHKDHLSLLRVIGLYDIDKLQLKIARNEIYIY